MDKLITQIMMVAVKYGPNAFTSDIMTDLIREPNKALVKIALLRMVDLGYLDMTHSNDIVYYSLTDNFVCFEIMPYVSGGPSFVVQTITGTHVGYFHDRLSAEMMVAILNNECF